MISPSQDSFHSRTLGSRNMGRRDTREVSRWLLLVRGTLQLFSTAWKGWLGWREAAPALCIYTRKTSEQKGRRCFEWCGPRRSTQPGSNHMSWLFLANSRRFMQCSRPPCSRQLLARGNGGFEGRCTEWWRGRRSAGEGLEWTPRYGLYQTFY